MKKWITALLLGLLLLPLGGCKGLDLLPYAREIEGAALMQILGLDAWEDGVAVSASTGVQNGDNKATVLSRRGRSISSALLDMQADGASYIFYGHVGQLLLGETLSRRDIRPVLDYVLRDIEMRLDTNLYLMRGNTAQEALSAGAEGGRSAAERLEAMEDDAGLISHATPRTVKQALEDLAATGSTFAPALELGENGELTAVGYGILKDGRLAGWAEGNAARGINLLLGKVDADVVDLDGAALRVVGAETSVRPAFEDGRLTGLEILCRVEANVSEEPPHSDMDDAEDRARMVRMLSGVEQARIENALSLAGELDADFLDLEDMACLAAPWSAQAVREQWDMSALEFHVEVQARILRGYDVDES